LSKHVFKMRILGNLILSTPLHGGIDLPIPFQVTSYHCLGSKLVSQLIRSKDTLDYIYGTNILILY